MWYREIMAVCSEIHTKYINTVCGQNVELLNVKLVVRNDKPLKREAPRHEAYGGVEVLPALHVGR